MPVNRPLMSTQSFTDSNYPDFGVLTLCTITYDENQECQILIGRNPGSTQGSTQFAYDPENDKFTISRGWMYFFGRWPMPHSTRASAVVFNITPFNVPVRALIRAAENSGDNDHHFLVDVANGYNLRVASYDANGTQVDQETLTLAQPNQLHVAIDSDLDITQPSGVPSGLREFYDNVVSAAATHIQ